MIQTDGARTIAHYPARRKHSDLFKAARDVVVDYDTGQFAEAHPDSRLDAAIEDLRVQLALAE